MAWIKLHEERDFKINFDDKHFRLAWCNYSMFCASHTWGTSIEKPVHEQQNQDITMGSIRRIKTKRRKRYILRTFDHFGPSLIMWYDIRDLDQVHEDLRSPKHLAYHKAVKPAEDLPGLGRWYCTECARWFEGEHSLTQHRRGKNHKRRFGFQM